MFTEKMIKTCTRMLPSVFLMLTDYWKELRCPSRGKCINKKWYIYSHKGILLCSRKEYAHNEYKRMDKSQKNYTRWNKFDTKNVHAV